MVIIIVFIYKHGCTCTVQIHRARELGVKESKGLSAVCAVGEIPLPSQGYVGSGAGSKPIHDNLVACIVVDEAHCVTKW